MKILVHSVLAFVAFLLLNGLNKVNAQTDSNCLIRISVSPEIEELEKSYLNNYNEAQGYRVQIGSESGSGSQSRANNIRNEFRKKYKDVETYIVWEAPNYKVRVGDFRTKVEASLFWKIIQDEFPNSYVVGDKIVLFKVEKK